MMGNEPAQLTTALKVGVWFFVVEMAPGCIVITTLQRGNMPPTQIEINDRLPLSRKQSTLILKRVHRASEIQFNYTVKAKYPNENCTLEKNCQTSIFLH